MIDEKLLKEVTEKANQWLGEGYDEETKAEVKRMLDNDDKTDLVESFYKNLEFGTGGLRGAVYGVHHHRGLLHRQVQDAPLHLHHGQHAGDLRPGDLLHQGHLLRRH